MDEHVGDLVRRPVPVHRRVHDRVVPVQDLLLRLPVPAPRVVGERVVEVGVRAERAEEGRLVVRAAAHPAVAQPCPRGDRLLVRDQVLGAVRRGVEPVGVALAAAVVGGRGEHVPVLGVVQRVVEPRRHPHRVAERRVLGHVLDPLAVEVDLPVVAQALDVFRTGQWPGLLGHWVTALVWWHGSVLAVEDRHGSAPRITPAPEPGHPCECGVRGPHALGPSPVDGGWAGNPHAGRCTGDRAGGRSTGTTADAARVSRDTCSCSFRTHCLEDILATTIPAREDIVRKASELIPLLRKHASWTEENRRVHDETIEALADAGVFKLRRPKHYGGYEADTPHAVRGRRQHSAGLRLHLVGGVGVLDPDLDGLPVPGRGAGRGVLDAGRPGVRHAEPLARWPSRSTAASW